MKTPKAILHQMAIDAWGAGLFVLVVCIMLEAVERGFVSRAFNMLWLLVFVVAASCAVMLTQPRAAVSEEAHRPAAAAHALLRFGTLLLAPAVWLLLPETLRLFWRAAAAGGILLAVLVAWPIFSKKE
ncbi:MAG: hypothetical protein QY323_02560 [Patescibacteria group bacterium]|nr:MAG: hypothetical protein QY323_02560 [Patescibacteria group bacterium]